MEVKIYQLVDREVHMVGEAVAVCWNTDWVTRELMRPEDGLTYTTKVPQRSNRGGPYIDFVYLREDKDKVVYESERSPVDGGMQRGWAEQIIGELKKAIEYFDQIKNATV